MTAPITSQLKNWQKAAAIGIGLTTGFIIGITSAGSGTVIAVALIALFKIPPRYVVGTDVFHAAILLWAAGLAHFAGGNIDFGLMGNLLIGSIPGVYIGAHFSVRMPEAALRTALGVVLLLSASATLDKAGVAYAPPVLIVVGATFIATIALAVYSGRLVNPWKLQPEVRRAESNGQTEPPHARDDRRRTAARNSGRRVRLRRQRRSGHVATAQRPRTGPFAGRLNRRLNTR